MDLALTLVENVMKYIRKFSGIDEASRVGGSDMMEKFSGRGFINYTVIRKIALTGNNRVI
ncbi:Hypothetical protein MmTuc01_2795 [Methanosarcina mazei Tuc01]|uniref:Uncharacterized protein n=1 Tax=Methanosarcina mazei Tuc01 TaxID=1236903 RepID=M1Q0H7_METMZ|nr:hypothetical protein [Methanosarcina mazei]AGF98081.1 Hypothetical protein MmTuc01_2795 [Methanosarcina mazei Tuc01]